jgi:hypothetical protein
MVITTIYVISEQTVTSALYNTNSLVFITNMQSVYSVVQTKSLYNTDTVPLQRVASRAGSVLFTLSGYVCLYMQLWAGQLAFVLFHRMINLNSPDVWTKKILCNS